MERHELWITVSVIALGILLILGVAFSGGHVYTGDHHRVQMVITVTADSLVLCDAGQIEEDFRRFCNRYNKIRVDFQVKDQPACSIYMDSNGVKPFLFRQYLDSISTDCGMKPLNTFKEYLKKRR